MRDLLRAFRALIAALPLWLALPAAGSAQVLAADVNGDGVWDRIEARRAPAELVVQLSTLEPAQHLAASGAILDVMVADINHDGLSDLIAATAGRRHVRLVVWMNAGRGRFVSRMPRDVRQSRRLAHKRVATPDALAGESDQSGDASRLLVLPSAAPLGCPNTAEPVGTAGHLAPATACRGHRPPRGPPATLLLS